MKNKIKKIFIIFIICVLINSTMGIIMANAYYYEGIPQGRIENSTESTISFKDIKVSEMIERNASDDDIACSSSRTNRLIGAFLTLIQVFGVFIGLILIIISVIKHIILLLKKKQMKVDTSEEKCELEKQIIKNKKRIKWSVIFGFILLFLF